MAVAELGSMDAQALSGSLCPAEPVRVHASSRNIARLFLILLAAFAALFLLSWPIVFSLNLWVFNDRGNLLNLDYLLSEGL
ncbi:MAG TPA: hypothetical protein VJ779_03120, partial [Acetobacteraceae bacterium]|nr:hypothetical protein [Acetobacteraceae bacterium]